MSQAYPQARNRSGLFSMTTLAQLGQGLLDLVFPPCCVHCGRVDHRYCPSCREQLTQWPLHVQHSTMQPLQAIASTGLHEDVLQSAIQALKYHHTPDIAWPLGERLAAALADQNWSIDIIVPVPLHTERLRERGYNQANELAHALATASGIPHFPQALHKQRHTRSQVELSREERLQNVREAFTVQQQEAVRGKTVLLVDDVKTTGATLAACAHSLLAADAQAVYGLTVSAAQGN